MTSASSLESLMRDRICAIMESNDNKSKVHVWNVVNEPLQCHFDLDGPNKLDPAGLTAEIGKYRDLGLEVYLNEVDIGSTSKAWNEEIAQHQRQEYKQLMSVALRAGVSQIHFWGLRDDDENWRRGEHPLLFAPDNTPKPAYYGVQEAFMEYLAETSAQ